jgi:hypothetical protein
LLTRVAGGTGRKSRFANPLGHFLADSSNFETVTLE